MRFPRTALNYLVLVGGELVSKLLAAITFAYLARILGAEAYGQLEFALAIVMVLSLVVDCGLGAFGAREVARDEAAMPRLISQIVALRCGFALLAVAVLAALVWLVDKPDDVKLLLALYTLPLLLTPGLLAFVFQGRGRMQWVAAATAARWSIFAIGVFLLVGSSDRLYLVPLVEAAAVATAVGVFVVPLLRHAPWSHRYLTRASAWATVRESLPIGISELVWAGKIYFATVLLGFVVGGAEVGWFGAAHRLAVALHAFVWLYYFNLLPLLSRAANGPVANLQSLIGASLRLTTWGAVFLAVVGTAFAEPIVGLVYGPGYDEAAAIFGMLTWFVAIALVSGNYRFALIAVGQQRLEMLSGFFGMLLNAILALLLIPVAGLRGAALSMVVAELLILLLAARFAQHRIAPIPSWRYVWRPLAAGCGLVVVVQLAAPAGVWIAGLAVVVAFGAAALTEPGLIAGVRTMVVRRQVVLPGAARTGVES